MKLVIIVVCLAWLGFIEEAFGCGGGSKKCTWSVCTTHWTSWSPGVPHGSCRWQTSKANHNYRSHEKSNGGCPGNTPCNTKNKNRYMCSCRIVTHCRWGSWGAFTGSVAKGTCGTQRRYRYPQKTYSYELRQGSCNGAITTCPRESDSSTRTWCNCRKAAKCDPTSWSTWAGHVPNGNCARQTSYRDFNPTYTYIEQVNNCHGIQPSCRSRETNTRSYCMCEYKHCVQQDWTMWTLSSTTSSGSCPNEERYKRWTATIDYKGAFANCIGIGPQQCQQDVKEVRKKAVSCPKLTSPAHGSLVGAACDGVSSGCGDDCLVECKTGFPLQGNRYATCGGDGRWSRQLGICKDSIPPTITCPTVSPAANVPNENYAMIELPEAAANDQSGKKPTVTVDHASPLKVTVGSPIEVRYTATDDAGNKRTCIVRFEAKDTEPPRIENCPEDLVISTEKIPYNAIWEEPQFTDNVDAANGIIVKPNHRNGQKFYKGTTKVIYKVHDSAFNEATCEFNVQISELKCKLYGAPKHGAYSCNINKNGVEEVFICSIACKSNYWFVQGENQPKLYDFYACGDDGGWTGQNQAGSGVPTFFEAIPKGRTPWPDCAEGSPPSEASKPFTVIGGSCTATDIAKLQADFTAALLMDPVIQYLFCLTHEQHCTVKNVKVYCSKTKKRSTGQTANTIHISFEFYVEDKLPSKDQSQEMTKMTKIISSMSRLGAEVKRVAQSKLKASAANILVEEKSAQLACEAGAEFSVVNGTGTKQDRSKCVKCPAGTKYVASTKRCEVCPQGSYQDMEGQLTCKACASGFSTHGYGANNFTSCKKICSPGTYSSTGLATCLACPKGMYQARYNSTSCMSCPAGKGTIKTGTVSEKSCEKRAIHVSIRSEGCDDPIRTRGCGHSAINVDGVDRSLHRRGYNLVVINGNTGAFEQARSFDTHGVSVAGYQMFNFVKNNIQNGRIVLAAIQDEATNYRTSYVGQALTLLKGTSPFQNQYRAAFAMLGYKGNTKPSWVRQRITPRYRGPAIIDYNIPLI